MKIVLDAMGGDCAPEETVKGAILGAGELGISVVLVGPGRRIGEELKRYPEAGRLDIEVVEATEVVTAGEEPRKALQKKDSSMRRGFELVKAGYGDAFVSAGNTGALLMMAVLIFGRIEGVERPAMASVMPTLDGRGYLYMDLGANLDTSPWNLLQFGLMGSIYAQKLMGRERPQVALLNVGSEKGKGDRRAKEAFELFAAQVNQDWVFYGNIEGRDVFRGPADVVVCDGFAGNLVLKAMEGTAEAIFSLIKEGVSGSLRSTLGGWLLRPALKGVLARLDYREYGGATFLGVNGICVKCHGSSNARAIFNGLRVAGDAVRQKVLNHIKENIGTIADTSATGDGLED